MNAHGVTRDHVSFGRRYRDGASNNSPRRPRTDTNADTIRPREGTGWISADIVSKNPIVVAILDRDGSTGESVRTNPRTVTESASIRMPVNAVPFRLNSITGDPS